MLLYFPSLSYENPDSGKLTCYIYYSTKVSGTYSFLLYLQTLVEVYLHAWSTNYKISNKSTSVLYIQEIYWLKYSYLQSILAFIVFWLIILLNNTPADVIKEKRIQ